MVCRTTPVLFLIALALGLSHGLRAQSVTDQGFASPGQPYVFISPLKTIDPVNPGLLYGAGIKWPAGYAVELGHLRLFEHIPRAPRVEDNRGNRFHLSLRRYLNKGEQTTAPTPYIQLRTDYLRRSHRSVATFLPVTDTTELFAPAGYQDSIRVHTTTLTVNGMVGFEYPVGRFIVDLSIGLGWRWRRVRHSERIRQEDRYASFLRAEEWFTRNEPGQEVTFNIPLDLRLIYRW